MRNLITKLVIILCLAIGFISCKDNNDEPKIENKEANRTILVYMVATNTLSGYDKMDIQEMLMAANDIDLSKNNIIVYHCSKSSNPKLIQITNKNGITTEEILKEYSDQYSSLEKVRFSEVFMDIKKFAPAKDYGLILWSHAMSWTPSRILIDNNVSPTYFGDDYGKHLNIDQLADAIPNDLFSFIWMDCCYMASIECAYELRNKCQWYIAYPTEILSNGMPYNLTLAYLTKENIDIVGAAEATFNYFNDSYDLNYCTISVVDMSQLNRVAEATKVLMSTFKPIDTKDLQKFSRGSQGPYYDFAQYVYQASVNTDNFSEKYANFTSALNNAIVYKNYTAKFLNLKINQCSGLSTHAVMYDGSDNEKYYYTLDWFNDIYPKLEQN